MIEWTTSVTKLETDNRFFKFQRGQAHIGKEIRIDLDSRREMAFINEDSGEEFVQEIVENLDAPPNSDNRFIPVELLDIA